MKGRDLLAGGAPQPGLERVKHGVSHLVTAYVGTFAGEYRSCHTRTVEEIQRSPVVVGVETESHVEHDVEIRAPVPLRQRYPVRPIVGASPQRGCRGPVAELRRPLCVDGWRRPSCWKREREGKLG